MGWSTPIVGSVALVRDAVADEIARGWLGAGVGAALLVLVNILLLRAANRARKRPGRSKLRFLDLIITSEDNCYSLSRLQIFVWMAWGVVAFVQAAFQSRSMPRIPANVAVLLGINGLTAALSTAITRPRKLQKRIAPSFVRDIFLDSNGTLDLARTQMFIWTGVVLLTHMITFWLNPGHGIPNVDSGLLVLMGVSHGAYLGVKAAEGPTGSGVGTEQQSTDRPSPSVPGALGSSRYLSLMEEHQLLNTWCWLATAVSVARFYAPAAEVSQCELAGRAFGASCCEDPVPAECDQGGLTDMALQMVGHLRSVDGNPQSMSAVMDEIDANHPIAIAINWDDGGSHSVVIAGYDASDRYRPTIDIEDPWYGPTKLQDFNSFPDSYQSGASWAQTFFTE